MTSLLDPAPRQESITMATITEDSICILGRECIDTDTPLLKTRAQKGNPPAEVPSISLLLKAYNLGASFPVDVLFCRQLMSGSNTKIRQHTLTIDAPSGSFLKVSKDVVVCSPEFCFLQMAVQLELPQLIMLGYEFCGMYTVPSAGNMMKRDAITTVQRILAFVNKMPGVPGHKKAVRALCHIQNGAASPMETRLTMLLTMPYRFGGYGLPSPELNRVIVPTKHARATTNKNHYRCDLYWPEKKLDVEYDSDAHHLGSERIAADAKRRNELDSMGITVVVVTRELFYDTEQFDKCVRQIAAKLGKQLRFDQDKFFLKQKELRKMLASCAC